MAEIKDIVFEISMASLGKGFEMVSTKSQTALLSVFKAAATPDVLGDS